MRWRRVLASAGQDEESAPRVPDITRDTTMAEYAACGISSESLVVALTVTRCKDTGALTCSCPRRCLARNT